MDPVSGDANARPPGTNAPQRHDASRIGLLGGSFNPAHDGHVEISLAAIKALGLDAVWWLVSPGNPLKDQGAYAPYDARLTKARRVARDPRIVVSDFERRKGLQYTIDTLTTLTTLWPQMRFCWLMGADSLATFDKWRDWLAIAAAAPIAVFNRPGYEDARTASPAARALAAFEVDSREAISMLDKEPPIWTYIADTANPISSTAIRQRNEPPHDD